MQAGGGGSDGGDDEGGEEPPDPLPPEPVVAGEWARFLFGLLTTTRGATRILDCGAATWAGPTAACPPPPARLVLASRRRAGSLRVASLYLAAKCWEICVAVRAWLYIATSSRTPAPNSELPLRDMKLSVELAKLPAPVPLDPLT